MHPVRSSWQLSLLFQRTSQSLQGASSGNARTMAPPSRIRSFARSAAGLLLLVLGGRSTSATAAPPRDGYEPLPALYVPPPPAPAAGTHDAAFGQVDVFIDLACPKSAAAWPTLKRIVSDQRHRVDFVFHVLPLSEYPIGYFAAKAVQVILANSENGTYDDVVHFIDWVFRGQQIILYEQDTEMTLDAREIVSDWALSTSGMSPEKLYSAMKDPAFDEKVLNDLENRFLKVAVASTPTVLFNGIFMMHLDGDKELQDFEVFVRDADTEFDVSDDLAYASDDTWSPAWEEIERETRDDYEEMERGRKAQQVARERRKFEQFEKRTQEQLKELDAQQQEQLKHLLQLQQDQLNHLLLVRNQFSMDLHRGVGSPPTSSSALGFNTPRYNPAISPEYKLESSSSSSSSASSSWPLSPSYSSSSWPYLASPAPPTSSPRPTQHWSTFPSFVRFIFSGAGHYRQEADGPSSAGDTLIAEAKALAAEWAARRGDQQQQHHHLRQHRQQQGTDWLSFLRSFGWPEAAAAESAQQGSSGTGGAAQESARGEGRGGKAGFEVGQEGFDFEAVAVANAAVEVE